MTEQLVVVLTRVWGILRINTPPQVYTDGSGLGNIEVQVGTIVEALVLEVEVVRQSLLLEETIKIDPPASSGGAFDPIVDGWDEEQREIEI